MKRIYIFAVLVFGMTAAKAQLIINELSQGPSGTKEYVELLVTGTPVCGGSNTVDLRGWIIDDNNSWHGAGSGTGIAAGHVRFDSIPLWANVKIGSLILVFNDADTSGATSLLAIDTTDSNGDCVYVIPISSSVLLKNTTLPVSNGSMTTYAVPGTVYSPNGTWTVLGMANSTDAFHTVSPSNYATPYHAIGWGGNNLLTNVYYSSAQGGKVICMTNAISNDPFDSGNFVDTAAATEETPGAPNNAANAAWIHSMNNNCQPFVTPTISFNNPTPLTCSNNSTVLIASSGTVGAVFNWSNGVSGSNDTVSVGGTYRVTVSDAGNVCTATDSITIAAATGLSVTASATNAACGNNNGTATVTAVTGTPTGYTWSSGATNATAQNLGAGNYTVTVTAAGGCTATASVTVGTSAGIIVSASGVNTSCGNNNGSATVTVTTGTALGYTWSNGGTSATISNLAAGSYTVTVDGGSGCSATASVTISPSGTTPVTLTTDTTIFCSGDSAHICAPSGYNSYIWNTGEVTSCIYAKLAGNYYVTVTDNGNCTITSTHIAISVYPLPPVSISVNGDTLTAYNAETFQWFFNTNEILGATSAVYIAEQSGAYTVQVSDTNGCIATSNAVTVNITGIDNVLQEEDLFVYPNPATSGNWNIAANENLIGASLEIFDNKGALVYSSQIRNQKMEIHTNLATGIYWLRVSDGKNTILRKLVRM